MSLYLDRASRCLLVVLFAAISLPQLQGEPLPLKQAVELALSHSTATGAAAADQQRAYSSYLEARNQFVPQAIVGSGLGKSWGFPLSLEGSAPSIVNLNAQSALINPALRDFMHAAKTDWEASTLQSKDQHGLVVQDTVLTYTELSRWEGVLDHLRQNEADARKMEDLVVQRIQAGVDSNIEQSKAKLGTARARLRVAQARGAIDVLRDHLAQLTGLPAASIQVVPDSVPAFPEVKQEDDMVGKAVQTSPLVLSAQTRASAQDFRARGEHRSIWPTLDFAAQYALLAKYNHYDKFFNPDSFQRNNATVGVVIRFPFLSASQRARAQAADAEAIRAHRDAETTKNQVSQETLKLQRSVEQLAAAQEVAALEHQLAQSSLDTVQVRMESANATVHDLEDARTQASERYNTLQDANFELERARIILLRATGELDNWLGLTK